MDNFSSQFDTINLSAPPKEVARRIVGVVAQGVREGLDARKFDEEVGIGFLLPPQDTYAQRYNAGLKYYRTYFDEALRDSYSNTLAMRRDGVIEELLFGRKSPVVTLAHHLDHDDPEDEDQKAVADQVEKVIATTPRFMWLKYYLMEQVFFGKYGSQLQWGNVNVSGRKYINIVNHTPVQGDKIAWKWDGTPGIFVNRSADVFTERPELNDYISSADRGLVFWLEKKHYREKFIIHEGEPSDFDFLFEGDLAGGLHGVGWRSRYYWLWNIRTELWGWVLDAFQRIGTNGNYVGLYPLGNAAGEAAMKQLMRTLTNEQYAVVGVSADTDPDNIIKNYPVNAVGYEILLRIIEYIDNIFRRGMLGQNLSSQSASTGLGSGVADFQEGTRDNILKMDATGIGETLDKDYLKVLLKYNTWAYRGKMIRGDELPFSMKLSFQVDEKDAGEQIEEADTLHGMGVSLDAEDIRDKAGMAAPKDPQNTLQGAPQGAGGPGGGMGPGGAPRTGQPNGRPGVPGVPGRRAGRPNGQPGRPNGRPGSPGGPGGPSPSSPLGSPTAPRGGNGFGQPSRMSLDRYEADPCGDGGSSSGFQEGNTCGTSGGNGGSSESSGRSGARDKVTKSQSFKSWFGDWENDPENASKVVNKDGKPLVVYHGTKDSFDSFDLDKSMFSSRGSSGAMGFFFATQSSSAGHYSAKSGSVMPMYLNIKNPAYLTSEEYSPATNSRADARRLRDKLIDSGYDGVNVEHLDEWIAFYPEQVKSATGNRGTFDHSSSDINYSNFDPERYSYSEDGQPGEPVNPSVMIALRVPNDIAEDILDITGIDNPHPLHITLAYLGKLESVGPENIPSIDEILASVADHFPALSGRIGGVGRFAASESSDGLDVIYAVPDVDDLIDFRVELCKILRMGGVEYSKAHGFIPHITLEYVDKNDKEMTMLPDIPLHFDALCLVIGDEWRYHYFDGKMDGPGGGPDGSLDGGNGTGGSSPGPLENSWRNEPVASYVGSAGEPEQFMINPKLVNPKLKNMGGNCGTGAGGFKAGNTCASGGGGSGSGSVEDLLSRLDGGDDSSGGGAKVAKGKKAEKPAKKAASGKSPATPKMDRQKELSEGEVSDIYHGMSKKWLDSLNQDEKESIKEYSGAHYKGINKYLRNGGFRDDDTDSGPFPDSIKKMYVEIADKVEKSLERSSIDRDLTLYRGITSMSHLGYNESNIKSLIGKKILDKGFISTSLKPDYPKTIAGEMSEVEGDAGDGAFVRIKAPKGSKGASLSGVSFLDVEREVLLQRGSSMKVVGVSRGKDGMYTIDVELEK